MIRRRGKARACAAVMAGLSLLAAACGGGDGDGGGETAATIDSDLNKAITASSTTAPPAGGATTTTAKLTQPKTMEEWEALWAKERDAIVKKIKDNKWGLSADGKTLTGPEGWTVDLNKCESGWSNTEGLSDTSIKMGGTLALSGTLADYGNYGKSTDALLEYYSKKGMFKDSAGKTRTVNYIQKDDGYDANRAIPLVDELLDSEKVFMMQTLGSPATLKTYDKINKRCVPHPLAITGHPAWGDPVNHPWTTGAPVATYTTEALFWGNFIEQEFDKIGKPKIVVAALVMNNDFGKVYKAGFEAFLAQSTKLQGKVEFVTETIEPAAPTVTDPMTTLTSKNPDIFIPMTAGTSCTQAVQEAASNGLKGKAKFLIFPNTCAGLSFIGKDKVGGDGMSGDGWIIFNGGVKEIKDPDLIANDVWIKFTRQLLTDKGINPDSSSSLGAGFAYAWPIAQFLMIAGQLDGGLTRTNFALVQRVVDLTPPTHLTGIRLLTNGAKDGYLSEAAVLAKFDAAKQLWINQADPVDLNGKSKNCAWDQATAVCK